MDIATRRLRNQRLAGNPLGSADEVVGWLGAVQAQDYPVAAWALGQRTRDATGQIPRAPRRAPVGGASTGVGGRSVRAVTRSGGSVLGTDYRPENWHPSPAPKRGGGCGP